MKGVDGSWGGCAAGGDSRDLAFTTVGPSVRFKDCQEETGSTWPNREKHRCQHAGKPGENLNPGLDRREPVTNRPVRKEKTRLGSRSVWTREKFHRGRKSAHRRARTLEHGEQAGGV